MELRCVPFKLKLLFELFSGFLVLFLHLVAQLVEFVAVESLQLFLCCQILLSDAFD